MLPIGTRVSNTVSNEIGTLVSHHPDHGTDGVVWDSTPDVVMYGNPNNIVALAPVSPVVSDASHTQTLKYARQAGMLEATLSEVLRSIENAREYEPIKSDAGIQFELGFCSRLLRSALERTQEI